ncbi:accessory Sec system protein Asp2, partial [Streptococcus suis]
NVGVVFDGDFGSDFENLFTFRLNLPSFSMSLELWPEYIKSGDCHIRLEVTAFVKGSIGEIYKTYYIEESQLQEPYVLDSDAMIGYYAVS